MVSDEKAVGVCAVFKGTAATDSARTNVATGKPRNMAVSLAEGRQGRLDSSALCPVIRCEPYRLYIRHFLWLQSTTKSMHYFLGTLLSL
jgi:hypothetical protein